MDKNKIERAVRTRFAVMLDTLEGLSSYVGANELVKTWSRGYTTTELANAIADGSSELNKQLSKVLTEISKKQDLSVKERNKIETYVNNLQTFGFPSSIIRDAKLGRVERLAKQYKKELENLDQIDEKLADRVEAAESKAQQAQNKLNALAESNSTAGGHLMNKTRWGDIKGAVNEITKGVDLNV